MPANPEKFSFPITKNPPLLKVGILITSLRQPCWAGQIVAHLAGQSFIEVVIIHPRESIQFETFNRDIPFFEKLFNKFDHFLFDRKIPPADEVEIDPAARKIRDLSLGMSFSNGGLDLYKPDDFRHFENLDVLLLFEGIEVSDQLATASRLGCITYPSRFLEWRIPERVIDCFYQLHRFGKESIGKNPYWAIFPPDKKKLTANDSKIRYLALLMRVLFTKLSTRIFDFLYKERWEIAFRFSNRSALEETSLKMTGRLKPPVGKIYGDPFPVENDGKTFVFFEEMKVDEKNYTLSGKISVQEIDHAKGPVGPIRPALQRDYHLSFPFVFSWQGDYYMLPETHQNNSIELYKCRTFPDKWEFYRTLVDDIPAVDTILCEKDGLWWMFTSIQQKLPVSACGANIPHIYALNLFFSESPLQAWQPHPLNPVKVNRTSVRCAGKIFERDGVFYRPAQDCTPRYGRAVVFNRIEKWTTKEYVEIEDVTIQPPAVPDMLGVHTYNTCGDLQFVDFIGYRNRFLP